MAGIAYLLLFLPIVGATEATQQYCDFALLSEGPQAGLPGRITPDGLVVDPVDAGGPARNFIMNRLMMPIAIKALKLDAFHPAVQRYYNPKSESENYWRRLSDAVQIQFQVQSTQIEKPPDGPLIVVANHPLSGVDGLVVSTWLSQYREDVKVVVAPRLRMVPGFDEQAIFIDPESNADNKESNRLARLKMAEHLSSGGALVFFPAGDVSYVKDKAARSVIDPSWRLGAYDLIRQVPETKILPVHVNANPPGIMRNIKPILDRMAPSNRRTLLYTALHIRAVTGMFGSEVDLNIGSPIDGDSLITSLPPRQSMQELKKRTYNVSEGESSRHSNQVTTRDRYEEIALDIEPSMLESELEGWTRNGQARVMFEESGTVTYLIDGQTLFGTQVSSTGQQLGKVREATFWPMGEGTGYARDIDFFDSHFQHIIVWDKATRQIIGAQRVAKVSESIDAHGLKGVYTAQFFSSGLESLMAPSARLHQALEVGRTFVIPEFQRSRPPALFMIWRTMGRLIEESNWRIQRMIGVASVSGSYRRRSLKLIMDYVKRYHASPEFGQLEAVQKPDLDNVLTWEDRTFIRKNPTISEVDEYIRNIEKGLNRDERGFPILLKNYLDMGARLLGVNFDGEFNSLDFAIEVFVPDAPTNRLKVYFGDPEKVEAYRRSTRD